MKRGHKILNACTVFLIFMSSFSILSFADDVQPVYYIPYYKELDDLSIVLYMPGNTSGNQYFKYPTWIYFEKSEYIDPNHYNNYTWYITGTTIHIGSYSSINVRRIISGDVYNTTLGSFDSNLGMFIADFDVGYQPYMLYTHSQRYLGVSISAAVAQGLIQQPTHNFSLRRAVFPSSDTEILQSLTDDVQNQEVLLTDYYNSLTEQISQLRSVISNQSSEYQSALDQAQSEIQSNVNSAASQAADDVNNAGEDISDINTNVDDVNSIVSKLQEWIQVLNGFADNLEDTEENVIDALESGKSLINQFFGVCPPIVFAIFGFALTFLVVRKIIGR